MNARQANCISLPTDEFHDILQTLEDLLALKLDPKEFIIEDPFLSSFPVKVDLRQHLKNLHRRMSDIRNSLTPSAKTVKIDFN